LKPVRTYLDNDWYPGGIPGNVAIGENVYLDTSYGFAPCISQEQPAIVLDEACGAYDRATFLLGPHARVTVGPYTVLNGTHLVCNQSISIGAHCLLAWGSVFTDTWLGPDQSIETRREILEAAARHPGRYLGPTSVPKPITLEDNVWVGFDSVIMPGVMLGRGSIVGSKAIVTESVPAYAVVVGSPARVVRKLEPDDTAAAREEAFREYLRPGGGFGNVRKQQWLGIT
jgi:acetyltransferase-like isoleucine patch superfamily enzyme